MERLLRPAHPRWLAAISLKAAIGAATDSRAAAAASALAFGVGLALGALAVYQLVVTFGLMAGEDWGEYAGDGLFDVLLHGYDSFKWLQENSNIEEFWGGD